MSSFITWINEYGQVRYQPQLDNGEVLWDVWGMYGDEVEWSVKALSEWHKPRLCRLQWNAERIANKEESTRHRLFKMEEVDG